MKRIIIAMIAFLFVVTLSGCGTDPNSKGADKESSLRENESSSLEANWKLSVNDTIQKDIKDIPVKYTLILNVVKNGGTTDLGNYTGTAVLKVNMDFGQMSNKVMEVKGRAGSESRDGSVKLDLVKYDRDKYDNYGLKKGEVPLSLLQEPDSMALGAFTMKGEGFIDASVTGIQGEKGQLKKDSEGTVSINYKINIEGGQVFVSIPELNLSDSFKGIVIGEPLK